MGWLQCTNHGGILILLLTSHTRVGIIKMKKYGKAFNNGERLAAMEITR